jgi:16S rRNA (cytosine967-C5)-methyltransferase
VAVRRLAATALTRIDTEGAYANLVLPALLERSDLDERDRALVTQLVYDTTRRRRSLDWLVDRFVLTEPDPEARVLLRLGADQLAFSEVPAHAAVGATVAAAPRRLRGFVNAVLRRLADDLAANGPPDWPDLATRLSYPDWVVERLAADLGEVDAAAALEAMDEPGRVHRRPDGYVQDLASQWVVEAVGARPGELVADLCSAPGGKATGLAAAGARVVAVDQGRTRVGLVAGNVARLGYADRVHVVRGDAAAPPLRVGAFDRVLVDAPCSGLGVLGRRPDARWRVSAEAVAELAALQRRLVEAAVGLVRPGGLLTYSVCTMTHAETLGVDEYLADRFADLVPLDPPGPPWRRRGRGAQLLPQDAGTDGMFVLRLELPEPPRPTPG